jgi:hypothetical protein
MLNFDTEVTVPSVAVPDVQFTVRRLSRVERAKRDLTIAEYQVRHDEIDRTAAKLLEPFHDQIKEWAKQYRDGEEQTDPDFLPTDLAHQVRTLRHEQAALMDAYIRPATIRAGLVSIEGLCYRGKPATAELLIANGPDELIDEVFNAIAVHARLSVPQVKNSESLSGSNDAVTASEMNTTASIASAGQST